MKKSVAFLLIVLVVVGIVASSALFTVHQVNQALVLQFGAPQRVVQDPGLHVKLPFVQNVIYYDKRILDLDPPPEQVILADQKRINVDAFARYRIVDPLRFFQSVRDELVFRDRFGKVMNASVRNVLGNESLPDLLSQKRSGIMQRIQERVNRDAQGFGIEVVDVRIGRSDLPEDISQNVYDRMRSEREREANLLRAEGDEQKQKLIAGADRQRTVIIADAQKESQILRGKGDAARTRILGDAYGTDPEFFAFLRSMEAYRTSMPGDGTTMVLSPDSDFFRYFGDITGMGRGGGPTSFSSAPAESRPAE